MTPAQERLFAMVLKERRTIARAILRRGIGKDNRADLEDMIQIVILQAWKLISKGRLVLDPEHDERHALRGWLISVTGHMCNARWKGLYRRRHVVILPLDLVETPSIEEARRLEAREALRVITYRLNDREREVLAALARNDTYQEIADALHVPLGTVGVLVHRLRKHLRKALER
jgi:RNA polymerase sigma factor (sigma-70 family)